MTLARRHLPPTRPSITHKRTVCAFELYVTVSFFDEGIDTARRCDPAEVFVVIAKHGSEISGLMDGVAVLTSVALQYGIPWETIKSKFHGGKFGSADELHSSVLDGLTQMIDHCIAERRDIIGHERDDEPGAAGAPVPNPTPTDPTPEAAAAFIGMVRNTAADMDAMRREDNIVDIATRTAADLDAMRRERMILRAVLEATTTEEVTELRINAAMAAAQEAAKRV